MNLKNKVALVTGASRGIGKATAIALAKEGYSVVINYKNNAQEAREVLNLCNSYSQGNIVVQADISKEAAVINLFRTIKKTHPTLHVLVNNAGIFDEQDGTTNTRAFENIFRHNFLSHIIVIKHALRTMKRGKIINISSVHGKSGYGRPENAAYSSQKAALENYTVNLAKQLAPKILVNAVAPGRTVTSMWGKLNSHQQKKLGEAHLIKRMIKPEEIANAVIFLATNDAVCGEILSVDGGYMLGKIS